MPVRIRQSRIKCFVSSSTDIDSLFSVGETSALTYNIKGLDDFELICFLVIK